MTFIPFSATLLRNRDVLRCERQLLCPKYVCGSCSRRDSAHVCGSCADGYHTLGQADMKTPPVRVAPDLYDSVVDNVQNPSMFVVFHDCQAYPDYLITFKWTSTRTILSWDIEELQTVISYIVDFTFKYNHVGDTYIQRVWVSYLFLLCATSN